MISAFNVIFYKNNLTILNQGDKRQKKYDPNFSFYFISIFSEINIINEKIEVNLLPYTLELCSSRVTKILEFSEYNFKIPHDSFAQALHFFHQIN